MENNFKLRIICPICGSPERILKFPSTLNSAAANVNDYVGTNTGYAKYHDMYQCSACQVLYMDPIDSGLDDLCSDVVDADYLTSWDDRALIFRDHLKYLKNHIKHGKLLDVGCYAGIFLNEAKREGFDVTGVEPSKWAAQYAQNKVNCSVYQGMFNSVGISDGSFDVVTIWDVIEHLANPRESVEKAFSLLRTGGYIAITTHDIESVFSRLMGGRYPWLMRFHLVHFSPKTLTKMLEATGFKTVETIYYKKSLSIQYFLKRFGINTQPNFLTKRRLAFNTGDMFLIIAEKK